LQEMNALFVENRVECVCD